MTVRPGQVRSLQTLHHVLGDDPAVVRGYASAAAERFAHGPLTLDARDRLLSRGERLGLRRFDANLVLAAVEQRCGPRAVPVAASPAPPPPLRIVWPTAAAALTLQATIVAAAWWLLA